MKLKDIVSVTGMPGLHKILGQNKSGLILEALADGKKFSTNLRQRVSILSDISMFEEEGEVKLAVVLQNVKALEEKGEIVPTSKADNDEVKAFMAKIMPNYDRERVYPSDMKKLCAWYHLLKDKLDFTTLHEEETEGAEGSDSDAPVVKAKPDASKTAAKTAVKTATKTSAGVKAKTATPRKMGS